MTNTSQQLKHKMTVSIGKWNNNEKLLTIIFNHSISHKKKSNATALESDLTNPKNPKSSDDFFYSRANVFPFCVWNLFAIIVVIDGRLRMELSFLSFQQRGDPLFGTNSLPGPTSNPSASAPHLAFPRLFRSMANSRAVPFVTASILENRGE